MSQSALQSKTDAPVPPARRVMDRMLIVLFSLLLVAPLACQIIGLDLATGAGDEKRFAAALPALPRTRAELPKFTRGFDAWYTDHFGLRRALIRLHNVIMYFGLHSTPSPKVIIGKDGWLFYNSAAEKDGTDSISNYRGIPPLTPARLEDWRWALQDEHDWCEANGIKFIFVIIPAKEALYPGHTPAWMTRHTPQTACEQLIAHLRQKAAFSFVDVTPALIEAGKTGRTFMVTDTHWTGYGAHAGWRAILPALTSAAPAIAIPPASDFRFVHQTAPGGDLAQILSLDSRITEDLIHVRHARPPRAHVPDTGSANSRPEITATTGDTNLPTALVFRDSFTGLLIPLLSENFQRVTYLWAPRGIDHRAILRENPDIVLQITSDRVLNLGLRYPTPMRDYCTATRFTKSTNILTLPPPRAIRSASIAPATNGWTITATAADPRIELGLLPTDASRNLPLVRLDITIPTPTDLRLIWRDQHGVEHHHRTDPKPGRHQLYFPLTDPGLTGPLFLDGHRTGTYTLHSVEVRTILR